MEETTNLKLLKPDAEDYYNVEDFNNNMDILDEAVEQKVNKENGMGLSQESFTTEEKQKLNDIEENANCYEHPKEHSASMITEDESHRFVTDNEKTAWNNKVERRYCFVGSDTISTAGWYKVASGVMSGYSNHNVTFMITSTYGKYYTGILQLQMRCDNASPITCKLFQWHTRIGFSVEDFICVVDGNAYTIYVKQGTMYGRVAFEIISDSNISYIATSLTLYNSTEPETTEPVPTVVSSDGATVNIANLVKQTWLTSENLDDILTSNLSWYCAGGNNTIPNNPFGDGKAFGMCAYRAATGYYIQEATSYSGIKKVRYFNNTTAVWSSWKTIAFGEDYFPITGGEVNGSISPTKLQLTEDNASEEAATKICIQNSKGWICTRTTEEILEDINAAKKTDVETINKNLNQNAAGKFIIPDGIKIQWFSELTFTQTGSNSGIADITLNENYRDTNYIILVDVNDYETIESAGSITNKRISNKTESGFRLELRTSNGYTLSTAPVNILCIGY